MTFKPGANPLEFSWANTLIDPTSVELRFLTSREKLTVLDTTFPHAKPQMLYWNVQSEMDGEATIEITYFTSGISWSADYIGIADPDESQLHLEGFVRVNNNSGEEYEDAQVRLVVGRINLVQKIAELARVPAAEVEKLAESSQARLRGEALRKAMNAPAAAAREPAAADQPEAPKAVAKEGLGEYFIYTIEGTETIRNGWSKRMRSLEAANVPVKIQYRYRPAEYGEELVRMYLLTNDKDSKLGTTPLPDGTVRALPPERPRRAELPGGPGRQVRAHRRQDRVESGPRPGGDLRTGQTAIVAGCDLDAGQRQQYLPPRRSAGRADRDQ